MIDNNIALKCSMETALDFAEEQMRLHGKSDLVERWVKMQADDPVVLDMMSDIASYVVLNMIEQYLDAMEK